MEANHLTQGLSQEHKEIVEQFQLWVSARLLPSDKDQLAEAAFIAGFLSHKNLS
jgi:hypothetical protein